MDAGVAVRVGVFVAAAVGVNLFVGVALGDLVFVGLGVAVGGGNGVLEDTGVRVAVGRGVLEGAGELLGGRDVRDGMIDVFVAVLCAVLVEMGVAVRVLFAVPDGVRLDPTVEVGVSEGVEIVSPLNWGTEMAIPSTNSVDTRQFEVCNSCEVIPDNAEILSSVSSLWTV